MTTYKGINGFAVQSVATDPSPLNEGQVWYNNATYAFKLAGFNTAAWATIPSMNTSRRGPAGSGTTSAALSTGGWLQPGTTGATEKYDGTSWTNTGSLNTPRFSMAAAGTQTATLGFGGYQPPSLYLSANESFNGSTWSTQTSMPAGQLQCRGTGTQTAAITVGALVPPSTATPPANFPTVYWNGTSWATGGIFNTQRNITGTAGTLTAALGFGGAPTSTPGVGIAVESYNGTSWTSLPASMNTARADCAHGGTGTQTNAICAGGNPPTSSAGFTELYNGSTWTSSSNLPATRFELGGVGNATSAIIFGGAIDPSSNITNTAFAFTGPGVATKTITTS
jgi:hypothetical protein